MRLHKVLLCLLFALLSTAKAEAAPGNLDNGFGIQGLVLTDIHDILTGTPGISAALAIAIHPPGDPNEGKIVAVGFQQMLGNDFALARYNPDGSLDTSFGTNGVLESDLGGEDLALAVLIYPPEDPSAGKILAAGTSIEDPPNSFALARYCPNGSLDDGVNCGAQAFGSGGFVTTDLGSGDSRILALAFQSDGKVVAAGYSEADGSRDFALARYNSDGSLDGAFNPSGALPGTVLTDFAGAADEARGVAVYAEGDPNAGKILAAGFATDGEEDIAFARYCPDGSLDRGDCGGSEFASGGSVTYDSAGDDQLQALALQADGKAVGAGFSNNGIDDDILLVRLCGDGALDDGASCGAEGFGEGGFVITEMIAGSEEVANALAIQSDGKILAAGASDANGFARDFALVRYLTDGSLDYGFGSAGAVLQDFSCLCSDSVARSMALQPDGRIVLSGASDANPASTFNNFALARFEGDPVDPIESTADLAVTLTSDPADPSNGESVAVTAVVTNNGPDSVGAVSFNGLFIGPFADLSVDSESCSIGSGTVNCDLGPLENGASATVTISLLVQEFPLSVVADVSGDAVDPNNADNRAVLTLAGDSGGGDDGGCSLSPAVHASRDMAGLGLLAVALLFAAIRKRNSI